MHIAKLSTAFEIEVGGCQGVAGHLTAASDINPARHRTDGTGGDTVRTTSRADDEATTLSGMPLMLTVEEAAAVLRIGRNTAYAAVADGSLPAIRFGSRIRIPRAGLAALVMHEAGTLPSQDAAPDVRPSRRAVG